MPDPTGLWQQGPPKGRVAAWGAGMGGCRKRQWREVAFVFNGT